MDMMQTALEPDEVLTEIRLPKLPAHSGSAYTKLANRASHYAVVGCAAVMTFDNGVCTAASVVITGASVKPSRASAVEAALVGKRGQGGSEGGFAGLLHRVEGAFAGDDKLDDDAIADAASHAANGLELVSDIHGSKEYRAEMCSVLARRAITAAVERAS